MGVLLEIVSALAWQSRGIGRLGALPWRLPGDMKHFRKLTRGHAVIMGRRTWESLPSKHKPLSERLNIVLSTTADFHESMRREYENVKVVHSLQEAVLMLEGMEDVSRIFVIGGESVYKAALELDECRVLHLTRVLTEPVPICDAFFPEFNTDDQFQEITHSDVFREGEVEYQFSTFVRRPQASSGPIHEEYQYLDLIRDVIDNGLRREDRTGTGTLALFGKQMRFNLRNKRFPLLTTKRVFWRGLAEELLWFISGSTNANLLSDKGVRIWDGNGSREFLDKSGFVDREVGDLGPVYGFQWRHFGATYKDMHTNYESEGVDQLAEVIKLIKSNPDSRRIILNAWNPAALKEMALPPCHMFAQFFVANGELSCLMYQRSCDLGLGVPFNIASYALLTRMLAQVCDLEAGDFIHCLGDAHVYVNHIEPLQTQLTRKPREFPTLEINPDIKSIDDFKFEDFTISNYKPYPTIKMEMAV